MDLIYLTTHALQRVGSDLVIRYLKEAEENFKNSVKMKEPSNGVLESLKEVTCLMQGRKAWPELLQAYGIKRTSWYTHITALRQHVNEALYTYFPEPAIKGQFHPLLNYLDQEWLEFCYLYLCWMPEPDENYKEEE